MLVALVHPAQPAIDLIDDIIYSRGFAMNDSNSTHARLQRMIDCQLELNAHEGLVKWEASGWNEDPGADSDEAPIKYIALVLLEAIQNKCMRISIDKDTTPVLLGDTTRDIPKAPSSIVARGLEILREIADITGPCASGSIALGVRNDSMELIVQKEGGKHILTMPDLTRSNMI